MRNPKQPLRLIVIPQVMICSVLILAGPTGVRAGVNAWTTSGPIVGGAVQALAIDPATPTTLYMGTDSGNDRFFKSTDGGGHWVALHGVPIPEGWGPYTIVIDPTTPTTVYAVSWNVGVLKSTDGGTNWSLLNNGLAANLGIPVLVIDPVTPTTLYAGTGGNGVFKSTDGGITWSAINSGLPPGDSPAAAYAYVEAAAIDASAPNTIYLGTRSAGLLKSTDGGSNWSAANAGMPSDADILSVVIDPVTPSTVYVGTEANHVFKSTDGGANWIPAGGGLPTPLVWTLALDPFNPATIYASSFLHGIWKSTDGGTSWSDMSAGLFNHDVRQGALVIDPVSPMTVYAGTYGNGVFKSVDGGVSWAAANTGLQAAAIGALVLDPLSPATVYAGGSNGSGVLKSTDAGTTWNVANTGLRSTYMSISSLAIDSLATTLYAGLEGDGVYKSIDGAESWNASLGGLFWSHGVYALAIDPSISTTLYAGASGGERTSSDGGATWRVFGGGLPADFHTFAIAIDPMASSRLYLAIQALGAGDSGVFRSLDGGNSWRAVLTLPLICILAIDPLTPTTVYAGSCYTDAYGLTRLFKSTDAGETWYPADTGLPLEEIDHLVVDPHNPNTLYAGVSEVAMGVWGGRIFRTTDGANHWEDINQRLPGRISSLVIDPLTPSRLYAGLRSGALGVFVLDQTCGNGVVEGSEQCDDGNLVNGDGCDDNCTPTGCGNGIVTADEQCDDGNLVSGDGCSPTCRAELEFSPGGLVLDHVRLRASTSVRRENGAVKILGYTNAHSPFADFVNDILTSGLTVQITGAGGVQETLGWGGADCASRAGRRGTTIVCKAMDGRGTAQFWPATWAPNLYRTRIWGSRRSFPPPLTTETVTVRMSTISSSRVRRLGEGPPCTVSGTRAQLKTCLAAGVSQ